MISKNKNLFLKIYILFVIIISIALIILQILGSKNRVGYLTDFKLNVAKTLELNNLENINNKLDEEGLKNFILNNENITNYIYHFRIRYYDKVFRNSDIYGVYPDLSNLPDYMENAEMEKGGSPYGNFISDKKLFEEEKIDNVIYTLKVKGNIFYIVITIIVAISLMAISLFLHIKFNTFVMKYDLLYVYFLLIAVFIIMFFSLKLYNFNKYGLLLHYETYGDQSQFLTIASMVKNEGWAPIPSERLGAPFGRYLGTYSMFLLMNFEIILMKIISIFFENPSDILQISYCMIFPITAIISFYVMRNINISKFMSIFGSLVFTFVPYIFFRNTSHYNYATMYFIPLTILLCIWLFQDDDFLIPNNKFFKNKKNIIAIFFMLLIANNGGGYYQFFSCFLISITAISKLLKTKNIKSLVPFIISIFTTVLFFIVNFIPIIIYKILNSNISILNDETRIWKEAEIYAFKISHLFFNTKISEKYYKGAMLVNENITEYSGIIVIVGFLGLILYLFLNKTYKKQIVLLLSELNIFSVLLATMGGFGVLFNYYFIPIIRSYNRISIYIAYMSILAFCIFIDKYFKKKNFIFYIVFAVIFIFSLYDQILNNTTYNENEIKKYALDKEFIESIEKNMPKNSSVYQFPNVGFYGFFSGKIHQGSYYRNLIGYIFSKDLRWSYGLEGTRKEMEWYKTVNKMNAIDLLNEISFAGFDGLYIDKYLYGDEDYINRLENDLINILGEPAVSAENGNLLFFSLIDFKENKLDKNYKPLINNYLLEIAK
ncbi:hypothetical protein EPJ70_04625 [Brachyspira aalborgi]|uniref:Uncharacterized protein n=1 Tax=Brachyspira aalborgi TaxID=29522 RepID=A0A5C8F5T6_9SPIR|nr:hypothetical protein [Brachyspira aalborgi]TXJ45675.1 hypothetical protein EPJ70_04625 [Brachyspira aalborgi]